MTSQEFYEYSKFLEQNPKVQAYLVQCADRPAYELRLCQVPTNYTEEEIAKLTYVKITIPHEIGLKK